MWGILIWKEARCLIGGEEVPLGLIWQIEGTRTWKTCTGMRSLSKEMQSIEAKKMWTNIGSIFWCQWTCVWLKLHIFERVEWSVAASADAWGAFFLLTDPCWGDLDSPDIRGSGLHETKDNNFKNWYQRVHLWSSSEANFSEKKTHFQYKVNWNLGQQQFHVLVLN